MRLMVLLSVWMAAAALQGEIVLMRGCFPVRQHDQARAKALAERKPLVYVQAEDLYSRYRTCRGEIRRDAFDAPRLAMMEFSKKAVVVLAEMGVGYPYPPGFPEDWEEGAHGGMRCVVVHLGTMEWFRAFSLSDIQADRRKAFRGMHESVDALAKQLRTGPVLAAAGAAVPAPPKPLARKFVY